MIPQPMRALQTFNPRPAARLQHNPRKAPSPFRRMDGYEGLECSNKGLPRGVGLGAPKERHRASPKPRNLHPGPEPNSWGVPRTRQRLLGRQLAAKRRAPHAASLACVAAFQGVGFGVLFSGDSGQSPKPRIRARNPTVGSSSAGTASGSGDCSQWEIPKPWESWALRRARIGPASVGWGSLGFGG